MCIKNVMFAVPCGPPGQPVVDNVTSNSIALHLTLSISETVRDRGLVPKDNQWDMAYVESNGHVTEDVT